MTNAEIAEIFTYHAPTEGQKKVYGAIRASAKELAEMLNASCPESREKSIALTKLQEAVMFANAAIAIHG